MLISKNIKFLIILLGFLPSIFVFFMVFKMNFYSPLVTNTEISTQNILPQGWAFFTKSPKDVRVQVFDYKTGEEISMKNFLIHRHVSMVVIRYVLILLFC